MRRGALLPSLLLLLLAACVPNSSSPHPAPSSSSVGTARCGQGDVELDVLSLGWAFCHPKDWSIVQRNISTQSPPGVDTTLDVVAGDGYFGFMIVGSYERGSATSLTEWLAANEPGDAQVTPIAWGNAIEAAQVDGQLKRYALTQHRVYALTLREGAGNLDLDAAIKPRLGSWSFIT